MNQEDKGQILLYQTPDGESRIEVKLQDETVWLNLDQMAELFQRNKSTISRHIKNVFEEGELQQEATVAFFATVQTEGKRKVERDIAYYNLDMIISVGYRVHSYRGVQFRQWATAVLKEYIKKDILSQSTRDICTQHRLRPSCRDDQAVLCHSPKQDALCGSWAYRSRDNI
jgi:hypothetical protein